MSAQSRELFADLTTEDIRAQALVDHESRVADITSRLIEFGDRMAREMAMRDGELLRAEIWADAVRIVRVRKDSGQRLTILVGWREIEDSRINPLIVHLQSLLQCEPPEEIAA